MTVYLDSDHMCHADDPDGSFSPVETSIFDGKCGVYIEGFRFIPDGQTWTRADGTVFTGEMAAPWKDYAWLAAAQAQHEADEAAHMAEVAELVEMIYESDMEVIG